MPSADAAGAVQNAAPRPGRLAAGRKDIRTKPPPLGRPQGACATGLSPALHGGTLPERPAAPKARLAGGPLGAPGTPAGPSPPPRPPPPPLTHLPTPPLAPPPAVP